MMWTPQFEDAFDKLKDSLQMLPFSHPIAIFGNASDYAVAVEATLQQYVHNIYQSLVFFIKTVHNENIEHMIVNY